MRAAFASAFAMLLVFSASAATRNLEGLFDNASVVAPRITGVVGITMNASPDFRVIIAVAPDSPAARAGVRVGDHILSIDGHSTSQLHSLQELLKLASGAPDTEVELQLKRSDTPETLRVRLRRMAAPDAAPKAVPDPSGFQASSHLNGLDDDANSESIREQAGPHCVMHSMSILVSVIQLVATCACRSRGSSCSR